MRECRSYTDGFIDMTRVFSTREYFEWPVRDRRHQRSGVFNPRRKNAMESIRKWFYRPKVDAHNSYARRSTFLLSPNSSLPSPPSRILPLWLCIFGARARSRSVCELPSLAVQELTLVRQRETEKLWIWTIYPPVCRILTLYKRSGVG